MGECADWRKTSGDTMMRGFITEDDDGEKQLTLSAEEHDLEVISNSFRTLIDSLHEGGIEFLVAGIEQEDSAFKIDIVLTDGGRGLRQSSDGVFVWELTRQKLGEFSLMIEALLSSKGPRHQYLETGTDETIPKISINEYPMN